MAGSVKFLRRCALRLGTLSALAAITCCSSAAAPKKGIRPPAGGEATFLDVCADQFDSLQVSRDALRFFHPKETKTYARTSQERDTVFYGKMAFLQTRLEGKTTRYFFGENLGLRGTRWFQYMEVIPKRSVAMGKPYHQVVVENRDLMGCEEGPQVIQPEMYAFLLEAWEFSGLTVGDLFKVKGAQDQFMKLAIDGRELPELSYAVKDIDLVDKLHEKTGANEYCVKDFLDIDHADALYFIPLGRDHLVFMQLTDEQLLELGAKPKPDIPPLLR